MDDRDYQTPPTGTTNGPQGIGVLNLFELLLRWVTRLLGFVLIVMGLVGALHIFLAVGRAAQDPKTLEPAVTGMVQLMNSEALELTVNGEKLALGKPVATVVLLLWYLVWAWLAISILFTGAKLVFAVVKERSEFLAAMKEFLVAARQEGTTGGQANRPASGSGTGRRA